MKKKANKKMYWMLGIIIILFGCAILAWHFKCENKSFSKEESRYRLENGIVIEKVSKYSGPFVENGKDEEVKNVWELTVTNTSDKDIQFLRLRAESKEQIAQFDITTLTAGSTVKVLERSAMKLPDWEKDAVYSIENIAEFSTERSIYPDIFQVSVADHRIRLANKTKENFTKDIYIYYKNIKENVYQGGITYRVKFEGGIAAEETKEEDTVHFNPNTSKILYLTFE